MVAATDGSIVTEATNPAGRVYRSLGFEPDTGSVQAYRKPPRQSRATTSPPSSTGVRCLSVDRTTYENAAGQQPCPCMIVP